MKVLICILAAMVMSVDSRNRHKELIADMKMVARQVLSSYAVNFIKCVVGPLPNRMAAFDDQVREVNYPHRTTVGLAPRYTSNRKFFANLLASKEFRVMIREDELLMRNDLIIKMKLCKDLVFDEKQFELEWQEKEYDEKK